MATFLIALHIFTCIILVFVVLIQSGKDGGLGMMGGGTGSSQSVFGSSGGADFFTKFTSGAAAIFMLTSIFLSVVKGGKHNSVFASPAANAAQGIPSTPAPGATTTTPANSATSGVTGASGAPAGGTVATTPNDSAVPAPGAHAPDKSPDKNPGAPGTNNKK